LLGSKNENWRRCWRVLATGSESVVNERTRRRTEALWKQICWVRMVFPDPGALPGREWFYLAEPSLRPLP